MATPSTPGPQGAPLDSFPTLDADDNRRGKLWTNTVPPGDSAARFQSARVLPMHTQGRGHCAAQTDPPTL